MEVGDVYYFGDFSHQYKFVISEINQTTFNQAELGIKPYPSYLTFELVWVERWDYNATTNDYEYQGTAPLGFACNYYYFLPGGETPILFIPKISDTGLVATGSEVWEQLKPFSAMMEISDEPIALGDTHLILQTSDETMNITVIWDEEGVILLSETPSYESNMYAIFRLNDTGYLETGNQQIQLTSIVDMDGIQILLDIYAENPDMSRLLYTLLNSSYNPANASINEEFTVLAYYDLMITNYSNTQNLNITIDLSNRPDINPEDYDFDLWMWEVDESTEEWFAIPREFYDLVIDGTMVKIIGDENSPTDGMAVIQAITISEKFSLDVTLPVNESFHDGTPPDFDVTIEGAGIEYAWYTIDGGTAKYFFDAELGTGTIDGTAWGGLDDEAEVLISFYVNNTFGTQLVQNITVYKDILAPRINIISPSENAYFGATSPEFQVEITDMFLNYTWYTINSGTTKYFFDADSGVSTSVTIDQTVWGTLPGTAQVTITFYANDSRSQEDSLSRTVNKNTEAPIITIINPEPDTYYGDTAPTFTVEIIHDDLDTMWYQINNNETKYIFTNNGTIDQDAWNYLDSETAVLITFYANTSLGDTAYSSVTVYKDIVAPRIDIIEPIDDQVIPSRPDFTVEIVDPYLNSSNMWYTLNETALVKFTNNDTISEVRWNLFSDGEYINITFYAEDNYGNIGLESVLILKDSTAPLITINSPALNGLFDANSPEYDITVRFSTGVNLDYAWYTINGGETKYFIDYDQTESSGGYIYYDYTGTIDETEWGNLDDETEVTLTFYANNTAAGTTGFSSVNIEKDSKAPEITINAPTGGQTFGADAPEFDVTITDINLESMWYTIDGGATNITFTENGTIDADEWNKLPLVTSVTITFYAEDAAGNIASDSVVIVRDAPAAAEGDDEDDEGAADDDLELDPVIIILTLTVIIIGLVGVVAIIMLRKRNK